MRLDGYLSTDLNAIRAQAEAYEEGGYLGAFSAETSHDPFLPLAIAAEHTSTIELGTSIAVAFARNPMSLAYTARDLNEYSEGRMILGLGSQIRPHITTRFSMPWSAPAARMREFINALHAIWACWDEGTPLRFKGEHYTHIFMSDFFDPGPSVHGRPDVYLAAVGPMMVRLAAEVCDGWMVHPFTTPSYFTDVALPRFRRYMDDVDRDHGECQVSLPAFVVTGADDVAMAASAERIKQQIGFYGSTPAYMEVLEHHGWGELHTELNAMTKARRWDELGDAIDDDVLHTFAAVSEPDSVDAALNDRYGSVVDRISHYT